MTGTTLNPRMLPPDEATEYVGGGRIFTALVEEKLLKPRVRIKGLTRYDRADLDAALDAWKGFDE